MEEVKMMCANVASQQQNPDNIYQMTVNLSQNCHGNGGGKFCEKNGSKKCFNTKTAQP